MRVYEIHDKCEQKLLIIEAVIQNKKNMLYENQQKMKHTVKNNEFLETVRDDYEKYVHYIVQQKEALKLLNDYLENKNNLSHFNKIDANNEQNKILKEIDDIKRSLDDIVKDTKTLSYKLNI